jgi:hypothetical protein
VVEVDVYFHHIPLFVAFLSLRILFKAFAYYENRLYSFCNMFQIDSQYLLTLENGTVPGDRWFFNSRITTDGLSATVHCARWVLFQKLPTRRSLLEAERTRRREIAAREEEPKKSKRASTRQYGVVILVLARLEHSTLGARQRNSSTVSVASTITRCRN